jgi:DNA-binding transcriptional LysR family regulator
VKVVSTMDLDLRLVRAFVVLVELRHFGRAAKRLHLTPSALTKQIHRLESSLGVVLLDRGPEGVRGPTDEGLRFSISGAALLEQADRACSELLRRPDPYTVRVGFPAGSMEAFSKRIPLHRIARELHHSFPEAHVVCCEVAFDVLNWCLPDDRVDILWTSAPVEHPAVESEPLRVRSSLVGLIPNVHPLAGASVLDVAELAAQPLLYNPAAPTGWMRPFWLADVRPRREARLVSTQGVTHAATTGAAAKDQVSMITVAMDAELYSPPEMSIVRLHGSEQLQMWVARRRGDHRSAVLTLIEEFKRLPTDTCP